MQLFLWISLNSFCLISSNTPSSWLSKVDNSVWAQLEQVEKANCIILLKDQADLSTAFAHKNKEEKGNHVFTLLRQAHERKQAPLKAFLRREGISFQSLFIINAIGLSADRAIIRRLASRPEVAKIINNPSLGLPSLRAVPRYSIERSQQPEWNLIDIGADQVWAMGYRGEGVVVGGQDTGVEWTHPTLVRQYRGNRGDSVDHNYNWYDAIHEFSPLHAQATNPCGLDSVEPCDDNVHGTHTMGTIVGADTLGNQIGVAPNAKWIGVRNMERGYGNPFSYLEAFQWFLAPTDVKGQNPNPDLAPHVINNSWYCPELEGCNEDNIGLLELAVENLRAAGIMVVTSAGNFGGGCATITELPAVFPASFSVGATDINQQIATFSSRGPVYGSDSSILVKPDVTAPGVNVRSASLKGGFSAFSGTSMAGPHVVGTVALMISANPALAGQVDTLEALLRRTARPHFSDQDCGPLPGNQHPNAVFGFGIIDAKAAVEEALNTVVSHSQSDVPPSGFRLFPNPGNGLLQLSRDDSEETVQLQVMNTQGQVVSHNRWGQGSLFLEWNLPLAPGIYFLTYRWQNKAHIKKFIIQ